MASVRIPDFTPAANGLPYVNAWPHIPLFEFQLGSLAKLSIGDAANGLCGGMSFTTADLHSAGLGPGDARRPEAGTARFDYIVARQMESFAGVAVPLRFYSLMRTVRPEREPAWADLLGRLGIDRHSRAWVMVRQEWPRIRADLDAGRLAMVGLISVVDDDPFQMNRNHQVVAFGYDLEGSDLTLRIYDPNWPKDDEIALRLDIGDPRAPLSTTWSPADRKVVCFFRAPYAPRDPEPWR